MGAKGTVLARDDYFTTTATFAGSLVTIETVGDGEHTRTYLGPDELNALVAAARKAGWTVA